MLEVNLTGLLKEAERAERTEVVAVVARMAELHLVVFRCPLKQSDEELQQTHVLCGQLHRDEAGFDHNVLGNLALTHRLAAQNGWCAVLLHDLRTEAVLVENIVHAA